MFGSPVYPPSKQREVAALMSEGDLTMTAVAARCGVAYTTVSRWNREQGWRPCAARPSLARRVRRWPPARVAALSRVYRVPGVEAGDLAEVLTGSPGRAQALFAACGFDEPARLPAADEAYRDATGKEALRRRLRAHVARQIAEFDRRLVRALGPEGAEPRLDSAKVLRDLVGLKRLLDDLDAQAPAREAAADDGEALDDGEDGFSMAEILALRASIARRYAAFEAVETQEVAEAQEATEAQEAAEAPSGRA